MAPVAAGQAPALHQTCGPRLSLPSPQCNMSGNKGSSFINFPPTLAPSPMLSAHYPGNSVQRVRGYKQPLLCPPFFLRHGRSPKEQTGPGGPTGFLGEVETWLGPVSHLWKVGLDSVCPLP